MSSRSRLSWRSWKSDARLRSLRHLPTSGGAVSGAMIARSRAGAIFGSVAAAGLGWGWFEAGWVRLRAVDVPLARLPAELDGVRVAHLSDFHLGLPSRGSRAVERAVAWVRERRPELVCITGDLASRPGGKPMLRSLLAELGSAYVVLGNHDVEHSR